MNELEQNLVQVVRLAIAEQIDDVRLYVARLVRKYRVKNPELAEQLDMYLRSRPSRSNSVLRKSAEPKDGSHAVPVDDESRLSLLKAFRDEPGRVQPLLSSDLEELLSQLVQERKQAGKLIALGLRPTRSAMFVGEPGVGKTLTARWLASQLNVPLFVLDLTAVMSSLLGRSGTNLRAALDFAKGTPCVLLLDEIDAIAKRRSDDADIGELKRLVTVILQEVDEWPPDGLLLGATNHPELIDPALWRRFDLIVKFGMPEQDAVREALRLYLGPDYAVFGRWAEVLTQAFAGESFSDIEREAHRFRRALALGTSDDKTLVEDFLRGRMTSIERSKRIPLAVQLSKDSGLSQHAISDITGVSRDTIRKHTTGSPSERKLP